MTKHYAGIDGRRIRSRRRRCREGKAAASVTFGDVLELWLENNRIRLKGGTIKKYQNLISAQIMPELGSVSLSDLTSPRINAFLADKLSGGRLDGGGGLSASYVRSIMLVINAAVRFAADEQLIPPLKSPICKPQLARTEPRILTHEEQARLEACLMTETDPTKAGILLSLHTGMRIGEVCALRWDDVDFQNRLIRVRCTVARVLNEGGESKTKLILDAPKTRASARNIPISSSLMPVLEAVRGISNSGFVISDTEGFVSPRTYEYRFRRLLEQCGVERVNYHALRHTFATRCIEAGVDVKSLSEMLGHSSVGITLNTYVHSSMEMKRIQIEKLAKLSA